MRHRTLLGVVLGGLLGCEAQVDPSYEGEALLELDGRVEALTQDVSGTAVGVFWAQGAPELGCSGPTLGCTISRNAVAPLDGEENSACTASCGAVPDSCDDADTSEVWAQCMTQCGTPTQVLISVESRTCFLGGVTQTTPVAGEFPTDFSLDVLQPPPEDTFMASDTGERVAVGYLVAVDPDKGPLTLDRSAREWPPWLLGASETHAVMYAADPVSADSSWGRHLGGAYEVGYHLLQVIYGNRCGLPLIGPEIDEAEHDKGDLVQQTSADAGANDAGSEESCWRCDEPDYAGVPFVCGNGVCERNENCEICSDCLQCDDEGHGRDSNVTSRESEHYSCFSTDNRLGPDKPGSANIVLKLTDVRTLDWPPL